MDFHPSNLPVEKTFHVNDEKAAAEAAEEMVRLGFSNRKNGFKIIMPKQRKLAQRIGYTVTTTVNYGLRQTNQEREIRYWMYHHDKDYYAMVLISARTFAELGY